MTRFIKSKKIIFIGLIIILTISSFLIGNRVLAQTSPGTISEGGGGGVFKAIATALGFSLQGIASVLSGAISWIVFVIGYIINVFAGVFLMFVVWLISVLINLNRHIVNSFVVKEGFGVTLSIANLGFVTALIVIAIATILRSQTYGIKQLLWKLVVAALLVNFSLVISGVILNVANQFTLYFLNAFPGGAEGSINQFAQTIGSAFQPQRTNVYFDQAFDWSKYQAGFGVSMGTLSAEMLNALLGLFFAVFFPIILIIVFMVFGLMLLIRYIFLGILLILMPLAWVSWIFPGLSKHWSRWWNEFIRWTFFAPLVMFFAWLAFRTAENMRGNPGDYGLPQFTSTSSSTVVAGLSSFFGSLTAGTLAYLGQMFIVLGLLVGGMIAANSLGITFANVATTAAKGIGKGVGRWAGKQGTRMATSRLRKEGTWSQKAMGYMERTPVLAPVGRVLRGAAEKGGPQLVSKEMKKIEKEQLAKTNPEAFLNQLKGRAWLTEPESRIAGYKVALQDPKMLEKLINDPALMKDLTETLGKREGLFGKYGEAKTHRGLETATGLWPEIMEKNRSLEKRIQDETGGVADPYQRGIRTRQVSREAIGDFQDLFTKRLKQLTPEDREKIQAHLWQKTYAKQFNLSEPVYAATGEALRNAVAREAPEKISAILPRLNAEEFRNFLGGILKDNLPEEIRGVRKNADGSFAADRTAVTRLEDMIGDLRGLPYALQELAKQQKTLANVFWRMLGFGRMAKSGPRRPVQETIQEPTEPKTTT